MKRSVIIGWKAVLGVVLLAGGEGLRAAEQAKLKLEGFGLLRNRELRTALDLLLNDEGGARPAVWDANFIEDAALVLNSELVEAGYFAAQVEAVWRDAEGREQRARLDAALSEAMPRDVETRELRLIARPGVRATVEAVEFAGLTTLTDKEAREFFQPKAGLYTPASVRAWSEARARRGAARLAAALEARGHAEARVTVAETRLDEATGRVELRVDVAAGPVWRVTAATLEGAGGEAPAAEARAEGAALIGKAWTRTLALDAAQATRRSYQKYGYPDVAATWTAEPAEGEGAERAVTAAGRVEPGPEVRVGAVSIEGAAKTRPELMRARVRGLRPGEPFDPVEVETARLRLSRLGVFRRVETREVAAGAGERAVVFEVEERAAWDAAWMVGYGSYEQARVGVEVARSNLWGRAHRTRFDAVQSFKSSRAEYRYTVPTGFDDTLEFTARTFGLLREEPSFRREEYGAALEARRELAWPGAAITAGYTYEVLGAENVSLGRTAADVDEAAVASVDLGITRDRRDSPIRPQAGERWSVNVQLARPELGSEVSYERVELSWSGHRALGGERWLHVGVSQGLLFAGDSQVPLGKLFYPGGESSIRGYAQGEATQRDAAGLRVGVRSALLVNIELEQRVTGRWSVVGFVDGLATALDAETWPGDEVLGSAGLGLRYQSPIGPLRLEYGHNLNPRPGDPSGTLHFSIGFPF